MKNPNEKSCGSYLPGSFDINGAVEKDMKDDVALGPPLNILVNSIVELNKYEDLHNLRKKTNNKPKF